ncbi:PhnA domain protein [Photobacterium jeanii]|uniref:PhnA domain protein n=1 Tax=Photobacterium jeanii TaxID=858640 RepID=A0A178K8A3_9GAMM|nr:PhnA domain-containing protein [Photobacterium jeanii]OAN12974.1 PhnA domain protein [Photobacterium jeanii]PST89121.1 PhnA domain protein [Photobacterium jeanii]
MTIENILKERSESKCELCSSDNNLSVYEVPASPDQTAGCCVMVCDTCRGQIEDADTVEANHWRCLNDSMWSQTPAVQIMAYRMLNRLSASESWAQDLKDMMYMEEDMIEWAEKGIALEELESIQTVDVNGTALQAGDNVTIIKDLPVKGSSLVVKQGTAVRGIRLTDNPLHITGKAAGTNMVIIAAYCKKM